MELDTKTPWGPIGELVYKRTYARPLSDGTTEDYKETVERVLTAAQTQLPFKPFEPDEIERLRYYLLSLKALVAGRYFWQLGTETVNKLGLFSLQNCAAVIVDHHTTPFTWAFDALMLGSGVGFNIQREFVYEIAPLPASAGRVRVVRQDTKDADFIVPDTREGWVELLRRVLEAHHLTGKGFSYSTQLIRGKGAPIRGFGGTASGPEELCWGLEKISEVLRARAGKKLRPIDCLDIMNLLGYIVVAGNVRRSALIALGDYDDLQYLNAKRWDLGNIPNWRAMSNNSVVCNDISQLPEQFWEGYRGNGEPYGLINLHLSQTTGRLGEPADDSQVRIFNPCAEISLENGETCCLSELVLPNFESADEILDAAILMYRLNRAVLSLPCHQDLTEEVVHRNLRMGIGVTGYLQATEEQRSWLPQVYQELSAFNQKQTRPSKKLTTCKPSGTLSLLPGVTSGVHPAFAKYYWRRVRLASDSPLLPGIKEAGYHVEPQYNFDGTASSTTVVASFPCSSPESAILAKDVTAVQQLEYVKRLQTDWADNAVSCTIYYRADELPLIRDWLQRNYNTSLKSVSFLLHTGHGFKQAPLEEMTKEQYELEIAKVKPLDLRKSRVASKEDLSPDECESGHCPIR